MLHKTSYVPTFKVDVYSTAILGIEVLTRKRPWTKFNASKVLDGERPQIEFTHPNQKFATQVMNFLKICWSQDPNQRPNMNEVHIFFNDLK
jgi:hypothetical protein